MTNEKTKNMNRCIRELENFFDNYMKNKYVENSEYTNEDLVRKFRYTLKIIMSYMKLLCTKKSYKGAENTSANDVFHFMEKYGYVSSRHKWKKYQDFSTELLHGEYTQEDFDDFLSYMFDFIMDADKVVKICDERHSNTPLQKNNYQNNAE